MQTLTIRIKLQFEWFDWTTAHTTATHKVTLRINCPPPYNTQTHTKISKQIESAFMFQVEMKNIKQ